MKAKFTYLALISLCISSFAGTAIADGGYPTSDNSGYSSSGGGYPVQNDTPAPTSGYPVQNNIPAPTSDSYPVQNNIPAPSGSNPVPHTIQVPSGSYPTQQAPQVKQPTEHHKKEKNKLSFAINLPVQNETIMITDRGFGHRNKAPFWVGMRTGAPLPSDAVVGGGQPVPPATLFVCRANYRGGMHPGKLFNGRCNIGWGGNEVAMNHYEVLVSRGHLRWLPGSYGSIPAGAIEGGYQQDGTLFICQADYNGGTHIGKIIGQNCNFGWGGREVSSPYYNVLVR